MLTYLDVTPEKFSGQTKINGSSKKHTMSEAAMALWSKQ